jgi:hypothetical protein
MVLPGIASSKAHKTSDGTSSLNKGDVGFRGREFDEWFFGGCRIENRPCF